MTVTGLPSGHSPFPITFRLQQSLGLPHHPGRPDTPRLVEAPGWIYGQRTGSCEITGLAPEKFFLEASSESVEHGSSPFFPHRAQHLAATWEMLAELDGT